MTMPREEPAEVCPSADALLRCVRGYSEAQEVATVRDHLARCERCRADYDSVAFLDVEILAAEADRDELMRMRSGDIGPRCRELTDERLAEIRRAGHPPDDRVSRHLGECAYCRQRLMQQSTGTVTLRDRIISGMLARPLESASRAAAAPVPVAADIWKPDIIPAIAAWVDDLGTLVTEGLNGLMCRPQLVYQKMGWTMDGTTAPAADIAVWDIPLPGTDTRIVISVQPQHPPEPWMLRCQVKAGAKDEALPDARLEIFSEAGRREFALDLRSVADTPIRLQDGAWRLSLKMGATARQMNIVLGGKTGDSAE